MGAWRGNVYGGAEQILFVISLRFPLSSLRHDLHQKKKGLHLPRNLILLHFLLFLLDQILFFFLGSGSFLLSTRHFSNVSSLLSHRKSDFGWIAFTHLPLLNAYYKESSKKSQAILMAFRSCILTGKPELLLYFTFFFLVS